MVPFSSYSFQQFTLDELPLGRDTWIMDEAYIGEWEAEWLKHIRGDEEASPYEIGYITPVSIEGVTPAGADILWYPNTHDRFHVVRTFLPRNAFVAAALAYEYEKRVSVFVTSEWLRKLHLRVNRRPKLTPHRRPKATPFVVQHDGHAGHAVRAGCGGGRA